jgi:hypothetical protein
LSLALICAYRSAHTASWLVNRMSISLMVRQAK